MGIYGSALLRRGLELGTVVCDPAPKTIEGVHIDITVGPETYTMRPWWWGYWRNFIRPRSGIDIDLATADPEDWYKYDKWDEKIKLPPGRVVLAHTNEFIGGGVPSILPELRGRSTTARWGVMVHLVAGWGDPLYNSRWTLEILNTTPHTLWIPVGARVGCIAFHSIDGEASTYDPGTRYNARKDEWTAAAMLPRRGNW